MYMGVSLSINRIYITLKYVTSMWNALYFTVRLVDFWFLIAHIFVYITDAMLYIDGRRNFQHVMGLGSEV